MQAETGIRGVMTEATLKPQIFQDTGMVIRGRVRTMTGEGGAMWSRAMLVGTMVIRGVEGTIGQGRIVKSMLVPPVLLVPPSTGTGETRGVMVMRGPTNETVTL